MKSLGYTGAFIGGAVAVLIALPLRRALEKTH